MVCDHGWFFEHALGSYLLENCRALLPAMAKDLERMVSKDLEKILEKILERVGAQRFLLLIVHLLLLFRNRQSPGKDSYSMLASW